MAGSADRRTGHVHGDGIESLPKGFDAIGMPPDRRRVATEIVDDVLVANGARELHWYKPPRTDHLACSWDDADRRNVMWIGLANVRVRSDGSVTLPARPVDWQSDADAVVGWTLPGSGGGKGGGRRTKNVEKVVCPETGIEVPPGRNCDYCDVDHSAETE